MKYIVFQSISMYFNLKARKVFWHCSTEVLERFTALEQIVFLDQIAKRLLRRIIWP